MKNQYIGGFPKKGGGGFNNFLKGGGWQERGRVVLRGERLIPQRTLYNTMLPICKKLYTIPSFP